MALCIACALLAASSTASASQLEEMAVRAGVTVLAGGTSDSVAEKAARSSLPLNWMNRVARDRANAILNRTSQFRRLPQVQYATDQPLYQYLVQHPDVAVSTWRALGISKFQLWQTGPLEYEAEAGDGSEGIADVLYRDQNHCLFICEGKYQNPLLPAAIEASALVWFRYHFTKDANGMDVVRQTADVFITFPSQSVAAIAKVLSPVTNSLLDRNLYEVTLYCCMMSRAVKTEPGWVIQLAQQLDGVLPSRPQELIGIARIDRRRAFRSPRGTGVRAEDLLSQGIMLLQPPDKAINDAVRAQEIPTTGLGSPRATETGLTRDARNGESAPPRRISFLQPGGQVPEPVIRPAVAISRREMIESAPESQFELQKNVTPPARASGMTP